MLMRRVGASYERCGKAKMQGVRFEKLTDNRELLSIPKSITHLNWKPEKGKDYHRQETTPRSIQVIQLGECAPMFVGVQALFSYRPRYVPEGKEIQLISPSLAIPRIGRQQRA